MNISYPTTNCKRSIGQIQLENSWTPNPFTHYRSTHHYRFPKCGYTRHQFVSWTIKAGMPCIVALGLCSPRLVHRATRFVCSEQFWSCAGHESSNPELVYTIWNCVYTDMWNDNFQLSCFLQMWIDHCITIIVLPNHFTNDLYDSSELESDIKQLSLCFLEGRPTILEVVSPGCKSTNLEHGTDETCSKDCHMLFVSYSSIRLLVVPRNSNGKSNWTLVLAMMGRETNIAEV
jgi:hypothetical protein